MSYQSNSWDEVERGLVLRRRQWLGKAGDGLPLDAHREQTALSPTELHNSQGAGGALSIRALSRPIAFHFFPIPRFLLVFAISTLYGTCTRSLGEANMLLPWCISAMPVIVRVP